MQTNKKRILIVITMIIISSIIITGCTENEQNPKEKNSNEQNEQKQIITTMGRISKNETWSGVVNVTGDITVESGATLTILPGTNVWIKAQHDDQNIHSFVDYVFNCEVVPCNEYMDPPIEIVDENLIHIVVLGKLVAKGTPDNWINIHSDAEEPTPWDWIGISANYAELEYVNMSNYVQMGFIQGNCTARNCYFSMTKTCPVCTSYNSEIMIIEHNHFVKTGGEMVDTHFSKPAPTIRYNIFGPGIDKNANAIMVDSSEPVITHNIFLENMTIFFLDSQGPVDAGEITYNEFSENTTIDFGCSNPAFKNNNYYGKIHLNQECSTRPILDLSGNYWGTTDIESIKARIKASNGLSAEREYNLEPILTEPVDIDRENIGIQQ